MRELMKPFVVKEFGDHRVVASENGSISSPTGPVLHFTIEVKCKNSLGEQYWRYLHIPDEYDTFLSQDLGHLLINLTANKTGFQPDSKKD